MKQIFALLFGIFLMITAKAQVPDSLSDAPYKCYYIDENSFQCDRGIKSESKNIPQLEQDRTSIPERERKFNPDNEEVDRDNSLKEIRHKYDTPEKESDSGILESDLSGIEIDSSTIIKSGVKKPKEQVRDKSAEPTEASGKSNNKDK